MFHKLKIVFSCANRVINNNNDKLKISCNKGTCFVLNWNKGTFVAVFQQLQELENSY